MPYLVTSRNKSVSQIMELFRRLGIHLPTFVIIFGLYINEKIAELIYQYSD